VGGAAATLIAVILVALVTGNAFRRAIAEEQSHSILLARGIEDQVTRTLDSGEMALDALAMSPVLRAAVPDAAAIQAALNQTLSGLPFLRTIAVADAHGNMLASTTSSEAGIRIDLERLGPRNVGGRAVLGPLVMGRGLAAIQVGAPAVKAPPGLAFIPLLRPMASEAGRPLFLVGLINPDAFSNFQYLALEGGNFESIVTTDKGMVLAGSRDGAALMGANVGGIPVFTSYLASKEHEQYVGRGVLGDRQLLAFRASSTKPLVVIVEESYSGVVWRWLSGAKALLGIGGAMVLLVAGLTVAVWRVVKLREAAQVAANKAQQRIAQSERELSVLMRSVQELIFRTDAQGVITYVNAHWTVMTGTSPDRAIGKRLHDLVEPHSRNEVVRAIDPRSPDGVRVCQVLSRSAAGKEMTFKVAVVPLVAAGRVIGFAGSAVDETERWMAQQQLQAQIAFQDLLLETNPLPISVTDAQDRFVRVNQAWEEYKGRERTTVLGKAVAECLPPDEVKVHQSANRQLLRWGGRTLVETQVRHGDGSRRDTRLAKAAIADEHGQVTGVLTILMDVSEFREAERATQEARDAAEEASRAKSEFVANMSHELRTPLQSILGFAELGMLRGRTQPKLAGMFEDIHSAGQRMLTLVNDLLEVSKLESTVGTFHMERIDLRGVVRPVIRELEPLLERSHLMMDLRMPDLPLVAKADPLRFQQVIRNVVANAIKFSPPGSTITLEGYADPQGQTHLVVRDEGPGIPPSELHSIFEAFVQSSKTKDGSGGTGLGLAICRKIVEAMGGRIFAENVPASGAAFHIILPARGQAETMPAPLE